MKVEGQCFSVQISHKSIAKRSTAGTLDLKITMCVRAPPIGAANLAYVARGGGMITRRRSEPGG